MTSLTSGWSARRRRRRLRQLAAITALVGACARLDAQQLLDRILARVGSHPITLTDVRLAQGLGMVEVVPGEDPDAGALRQIVERYLLSIEMARLQVLEPTPEAIEAEAARMRARVLGSFDELLQSTGYDVAGVRELARETLRIEAYVRQRFGPAVVPTDADVRAWLSDIRSRAQVDIVGSRR